MSISRTGSFSKFQPSTPKAVAPKTAAALPKSSSSSVGKSLSAARPVIRDGFVSAPRSTSVTKTAAANAVKPSGEVTEAQVLDALREGKTDDATRKLIGDYFKTQSMAGSHATMEKIRSEGLLGTFIDATVRDASGNPPGDELKAGLTRCMETGRLDVYAETLATTAISVGDYEGKLEYRPGTNEIVLDKNSIGDTQNLANILAHEMFHAFAQAHGGGDGSYGALNEGFGIAAREYAFTDGNFNLAEMVYGTKNFYRDYKNNPDYGLGDMKNADPKLREFLEAMAGRDSSQLAWDNPEQLKKDYDTYFKDIPRNQSWDTWLQAVDAATQKMLEDRKNPPQDAQPAQPAKPSNPLVDFFKRLFGW